MLFVNYELYITPPSRKVYTIIVVINVYIAHNN
jgi:hypothetical protein